MKKNLLISFILFTSLILFNNIYGQINQDWKWVHPKPQGNTFRYVKMITPTTWYAVGYAGTFMSTTNSGTNWNIYTNAGGTNAGYAQGKILYSGWFFSATTGLVCGSAGWIARTTNSGVSWDSIPGGGTATLYGIHFINANTGFIGGTSGTVLKSTDAGLTWTAIPTGGTLSVYNIFALDANNIFAPTSSSGVLLITTNGGTNWVSSSTTGVTLYDANFINPNTGFVCGSAGHIKLTVNGGLNWTSVNVPSITSAYYELYTTTQPTTPLIENFDAATFPPTGWRAVNVVGPVVWVRSTAQFHSTPASAFINYDCSPSGLDWLITPQRTINAGDSISFWLRKLDSGYPDSLQIKVSTTDTALTSFTQTVLTLTDPTYPAAGTWGRYAASLNAFAGQNVYIAFRHWDACGDGVYLDDVQIGFAGTSAVVYAVGDAQNIYKTANMGANWTAVMHLDPAQPWTSTWYSMGIDGTNMVAVGASGLFNASTNSGANWVTKHSWLSPGIKYDVWCEYGVGKVWAVGAPGSAGATYDQILYSSNGGVNFTTQVITGSTATYRSINMLNGLTGYICGSNSCIRKTTNGGTTWDSLITSLPTGLTLYKIDFINASTGWVFSQTTNAGGTIWKTINGAANWTQQTTGTIDGRIYAADMVDANTGYVGNYTPKVIKTTDGGATWTELVNTPMGSGFIYDMEFISGNSGYVVGSAGARVCKTTNGGTSWDTIATPYATTYYGTDWTDWNNGFIVGASGVTAKTTNGGATWGLYNNSGSTTYGIFAKTQDTAYCSGTSGYVFKWQKQPTGIMEWQNSVPNSYFLSQNYPNPFNPNTTIKFGIPVKGAVSLRVYDITGRLVHEFFSNTPLNAGTVTVDFNATNLASGVYFYSLLVDDNKIDTKKMVLVK